MEIDTINERDKAGLSSGHGVVCRSCIGACGRHETGRGLGLVVSFAHPSSSDGAGETMHGKMRSSGRTVL